MAFTRSSQQNNESYLLMRYLKKYSHNQISWFALTSRAVWRNPADVKTAYRNASFLANNRIVFNIKGNEYRLIAAVHYNRGMMFIRFVGTHREYDKIDAVTI